MPNDPFQAARRKSPILKCPFQGEDIPMLLRHGDVRSAARDWHTFSSDAPFRVPIPSEENLRTMRQLPIETNPPEHTAYRRIVEPFFKRAKSPEVISKVNDLINRMLSSVLEGDSFDAVNDFALSIQSHALTYLLNVPESEATTYISWGIHVFREQEGETPPLEEYLALALEKAAGNPGPDFFSALNQASYEGRALTHEEKMGFANLTFAGGRDTIIHSITSILHHFGNHPKDLDIIRNNPKAVILAGEEFFRAFMPLTQIGRVCPVTIDLHGHQIPGNGRVSLGWAAANFDEEVFEDPETIRLDRKPNPHLSFGFGPHLCLGAPHARLIIRSLLEALGGHVAGIEIQEAVPHLESNPAFQRQNGFDRLDLRLLPRG